MSKLDLWCYSDTARIGIVENIESLQWLEQYQGIGKFELKCLSTAENIDLLKKKRLLYKTDGDTCGVIEYVEIDDSAEKASIIVRGYLYAGMLRQRIVLGTARISNVENGMRLLVSDNLRGLPIGLAPSKLLRETVDTEITWKPVDEALTTLAEASGLGYKVIFDPRAITHAFEVYKGADRRAGTGVNYRGYFGDDLGNIENINILDDVSEYKNVAIVAGEGEGAARVVEWVRQVPEGDIVRELYVDARDLRRTYTIVTDTGLVDEDGSPITESADHTYTESEYKALLRARGLEKLAEVVRISEITASVRVGEQFAYRTDFNLGDLVTMKSAKYGLTLGMRIAEVLEIYEATGYQCNVTLTNI